MYILFPAGVIRAKGILQKNAYESLFLISESSLFHLLKLNCKNRLWKSSVMQPKVLKQPWNDVTRAGEELTHINNEAI